MLHSPLRYPGGKSRAVERITGLIPPFKEFREPFVGGGSVFVQLKQKFPDRKFWINDKYKELVIFWDVLQNDSEKLTEKVFHWRQKFNDGKELFYFMRKNMAVFDRIETAAAFFIFNRITFSGTTQAGGFSIQAFEKRFTDSSIERLNPMPDLLKNVKITNSDYEELTKAKGENVFLFLDPPYFSNTNSALYGKNGTLHKSFDHQRLAETLKKCSHKWLLSYDDSPFVRELFSFANIQAWNLTYGMKNVANTSNQKGCELFISNYELKTIEQKQTAFSFAK